MLLSWDAAAVRAAEEPLLAAGEPLMARASWALAARAARLLRDARGRTAGARVVLLVGPGSNGGDTLHAGALLARRGVAVTALLASPRVHAEGLAALRSAHGRVVDADRAGAGDGVAAALAGADVVLDGLLGIGARGGLRDTAAHLVRAVDALEPRPLVVAVDVPSGVGVDDGSRPGPVLDADLTVTFGVRKPALVLPPASWAAGDVELVDLGLDPPGAPVVAVLEDRDVASLWPVPRHDAHKYTRGVLGVVAGSARYPGAAVLSVAGALHAGVGMVRYQGSAAEHVLTAHPEVVVGPGRVQAWVVGSGVAPDDEEQRDRVRDVLARAGADDEPVVVDAGALDLLPSRVPPHVVLTPHAGELAALLTSRGRACERGDVERRPWEHARAAHRLTGATVLLKGPTTVVAGPAGAGYAQSGAPAWTATAGAGDVLGGVLGALLAGRAPDAVTEPTLPAALAAAAALVHGRAAAAANPGGPVTASQVARAVPRVVAQVLA